MIGFDTFSDLDSGREAKGPPVGLIETLSGAGPRGVGDVAAAAFANTRFSENSNARREAIAEVYARIGARVREATGVDLGDPWTKNSPAIVKRINRGEFRGFSDPALDAALEQERATFLDRARALKAQNPETLADLDLDTAMAEQGKRVSGEARAAFAHAFERDDIGLLAKGVGWLGSLPAAAYDAPNWLAAAFPAGGAGATALKRLLSMSLAGGAGGAAGAALGQPDIQRYRAEQGLPSGPAEAAKDIALGGLAGAGLGGLFGAAGEGLARLLRGKGTAADLAAAVRATGREASPDELAALAPAQAAAGAEERLAAALAAAPPDRRQKLARDALAHLTDPTTPAPLAEPRLPAVWANDSAQKAVAGAQSFEEAVDRLRASGETLTALASSDPQLRAAGRVAALSDAALTEVRARGLPPQHAELIVGHTRDPALQAELAGVLAEARAESVAQARMILTDHMTARTAGAVAAQRVGRPLIADDILAPHRVTDADGRVIVVAPRLVEAASLTTSADSGFPAGLQPRERARIASTQQVRELATRLDPERLGRSAEADRGAPIVGPDGIVESGNGRVMALRAAYEENGPAAAAYRAWLEKQGFDLDGFSQPVLARFRASDLTEAERHAFVVAANRPTTLALSAVERARADAALLDADLLGLIAAPDLAAAANRDFLRAFLARLPASEHGALVDAAGQLSAEGLARARNAVTAQAYGASPVLQRIAESVDDDMRSVSAGLLQAAPAWARLRADVAAGLTRAEMDVTEKLLAAVDRAARLRERGVTLADGLAQTDAFAAADPVVDDFLRMLYSSDGKRAASTKRIADAVGFYAQEARRVSAEAGLDFGLAPVGPGDVTQTALRRTGDDLAIPRAGDGAAGDGAGAGAAGAGASGPGAGDARLLPAGDPAGAAPQGGGAAGGRGGGDARAGAGGAGDGAGEGAARSGGAEGGVESLTTRAPDRALDARAVEIDGETRFVAAQAADAFAPRERHLADVVKACKS